MFYSSPDSDEVQRFKALSVMLERLKNGEGQPKWLSDEVHSVHLIDWDWRSDSRRYNHRHVPMIIRTPEVFDWYRDYGIFVHLALEERAQRFSLARFFLELTPRRDVIIIHFDHTGKELFTISRLERMSTIGGRASDPGAAFAPDTIVIKVNRDRASELCSPLAGLLTAFRKQYPPSSRPAPEEIIKLADTIGGLEGPVSCLLAGSQEAKAAADAYMKLPEQSLETMGGGVSRLHWRDGLPREPSPETTRDTRILLANLAVQAYVMPDSLQGSSIAIVPGIAQVEDGKPMAAGAFLLHYNPPKPTADMEDWLVVATAWAREKATFDLVERSRRQQLAGFLHNLANRFGALIARVRALEPVEKARALADEMASIEGASKDATTWVRGRAKYTDHVSCCPAEVLAEMVGEVLSSLAGNQDVLINLFDQHDVSYEIALASIREAVDLHEPPAELHNVTMAFSRRLARELLDELIKNALEYTPWSASVDARVVVSFGSDHDGLYVNLANPVTAESLRHLEGIAESLRSKRHPEVLGLGLRAITNRCENEGLPWPVIGFDQRRLRVIVRCHLARTLDAQSTPIRRNRIVRLPPGDES
jgi:hypothetical protein